MSKELGEVFVDGRIINLDNSSLDLLENALNTIREQRVKKINSIAKIVSELQG